MLHKTIKILPQKKEDIFICAINNSFAQSGYNMNSRSVKVKDQEEFFLAFNVFNKTKFKHEKIKYPNLWMELNILDEELKTVQPKFKIIKEMGVIIKKKQINLKKFNFEVVLKNQRGVLDRATIFVV